MYLQLYKEKPRGRYIVNSLFLGSIFSNEKLYLKFKKKLKGFLYL